MINSNHWIGDKLNTDGYQNDKRAKTADSGRTCRLDWTFCAIFHFFMHASMYSEQMQSDITELLYAAQEKGLISKMRIALIQDRRDVWET